MSSRWYYAYKETTLGPIEERHLKQMASTAAIDPNGLIWPEWGERSQAVVACCALDFGAAGRRHDRPAPAFASPHRLPPSPARLERARELLEQWLDLTINRDLILSGNDEALRQDMAVQMILRTYSQSAPAAESDLIDHLQQSAARRRAVLIA